MSPLLSFQAQFADDVRDGIKTQTMRLPRKDGRDPKPGQTLYCWTRLRHRTLPAIKLGEFICKSVQPIEFEERWLIWLGGGDRHLMTQREAQAFAVAEGFRHREEEVPIEAMCDWVEKTHGLPFEGFLYIW